MQSYQQVKHAKLYSDPTPCLTFLGPQQKGPSFLHLCHPTVGCSKKKERKKAHTKIKTATHKQQYKKEHHNSISSFQACIKEKNSHSHLILTWAHAISTKQQLCFRRHIFYLYMYLILGEYKGCVQFIQ